MGSKDHSFSERWRNWEVDEIETGYPRSLQDSIGPLHVNFKKVFMIQSFAMTRFLSERKMGCRRESESDRAPINV